MTHAGPEPLSWLKLERYALGELGAEQRAQVERELAHSEGARAALAAIREPLALPPLPVVSLLDARRKVLRRRLSIGAAFAAAAAALALALITPDALPPARRGVKGGELGLELVGERTGAGATHFAQHERFKLLVTCPPELSGRLRAVIYQGDAIFMPLEDGGPVACGNRSPWPGAFTLDGEHAAHVCVRADGRSWPASRAALRGDVVCVTLSPGR
jgi:hypothetical protein